MLELVSVRIKLSLKKLSIQLVAVKFCLLKIHKRESLNVIFKSEFHGDKIREAYYPRFKVGALLLKPVHFSCTLHRAQSISANLSLDDSNL